VQFSGNASIAAPTQNLLVGLDTRLVGWLVPLNPVLGGAQIVGVLSVPIPASAPNGSTYQLPVGEPSGTSDGVTDVPIAPGRDGILRVTSRPFLVCDIDPAPSLVQSNPGDPNPPASLSAGSFGDGTIDNFDVLSLFRASLLPAFRRVRTPICSRPWMPPMPIIRRSAAAIAPCLTAT
jgi:hypothetical protein